MKPQELRALSQEELAQKQKTLKDELAKLNLQRYSGRVEKPHMFSQIKKDIARINTILNHVRDTNDMYGKDKISNMVNTKKEK